MAEDKLQASRFELKYVIPEHTAFAVRDFVAGYLDIDEFGATQPNYSYPVHSLYLDSPNLSTFRWTINGDKNRYKLRLRFYDNQNDSPVFFEIKRRVNNTIAKQRGGVRRQYVDEILAGQLPRADYVLSKDPRQFQALQNFSKLMGHLDARPMAHIFYMREAWISRHDNSVRVTLDRNVLCDPQPCAQFETTMVNPVVVFGNSVVLELKFTNRYPDWFRDLVKVFGLTQCGAAKYAEGVEMLGEERLSNAFALGAIPVGPATFLSEPVGDSNSLKNHSPIATIA